MAVHVECQKAIVSGENFTIVVDSSPELTIQVTVDEAGRDFAQRIGSHPRAKASKQSVDASLPLKYEVTEWEAASVGSKVRVTVTDQSTGETTSDDGAVVS